MWPYLTLFGWSFAAATILPLGSEPAAAYLVAQGRSAAMVVAVATFGNYLGACTTYWIGRRLRRRTDEVGTSSDPRALRLLRQYGAPALLLSWVPVIGDAIVAAAGVVGIPFGTFSFFTAAGKLARYILVAWGASLLPVS